MACRIVMPSFGMYTADGTLSRWRQPSGARVEAGEVVLEIETEKAVQEVEAPASGVLHHVLDEGARLQVESLIGYVLAPDEAPPADTSGPAAASSAAVVASLPATAPHTGTAELRASPMAKRLGREHNIDLATIAGTGPGGRIVEADLRAALESRARSTPVAGTPWNGDDEES